MYVAVVYEPSKGGWLAARFDEREDAKALVRGSGGRYGLGRALRKRGQQVGNHVGGDVFVIPVVDGGTL